MELVTSLVIHLVSQLAVLYDSAPLISDKVPLAA
jgi:hypothetical protein